MTDHSMTTPGSADVGDYNNEENSAQPRDVFVATLYSLVFIIGLIGNGLLVCAFIKYRRFTLFDWCFFNIALSDLFFLASLPFWAYDAMVEWVFGNFMCHAITALYMLGLYGSIFFMVFMTVYRYMAIVYTMRYRSVRRMNCVIVWMLSILASLPNVIFTHEKKLTYRTICAPDFPSPAWSSFTLLELNFLSLIIPLIIIVFCNSQIFLILSRLDHQKRNKVVILLLTVVVVYFLCWTPYNIGMFLIFLQTQGYLDPFGWSNNLSLIMQWFEVLAFCHCCLNPIIHVSFSPRSRETLTRYLKDHNVCVNQCACFSQEIPERREQIVLNERTCNGQNHHQRESDQSSE